MITREEIREGIAQDEYDMAWLEAERDLAISRWEHPEYWRHWEDEPTRDFELDKQIFNKTIHL